MAELIGPSSDRPRHDISGTFARESIAYCAIVPEEGLMALVYSWVDGQDKAGYAVTVFEGGPEPALRLAHLLPRPRSEPVTGTRPRPS